MGKAEVGLVLGLFVAWVLGVLAAYQVFSAATENDRDQENRMKLVVTLSLLWPLVVAVIGAGIVVQRVDGWLRGR